MLVRAPVLLHPGHKAGKIYPLHRGACTTAVVAAADTIYLYCFMPLARLPFNAAQLRCATGQTGAAVKAAIYANDPAYMLPVGAPLFVHNTELACTATGYPSLTGFGSGTIWEFVPIWVAVKSKGGGTQPTLESTLGLDLSSAYLMGSPAAGGGINGACITYADAFANNMPTFAQNATFTPSQASAPIIGVTAA